MPDRAIVSTQTTKQDKNMKKALTYKQRLALKVNAAVASLESKTSFPYDFSAYASVAAKCNNKRLSYDWR